MTQPDGIPMGADDGDSDSDSDSNPQDKVGVQQSLNLSINILDDFGEPMYVTPEGVEYRIRKSTRNVFTYRPPSEQWLYICSEASWPDVAATLGLRVRRKKKSST